MFFYKTSFLNEDINSTEPSPSVSILWLYSHILDTSLNKLDGTNTVAYFAMASRKKKKGLHKISISAPENFQPWTI